MFGLDWFGGCLRFDLVDLLFHLVLMLLQLFDCTCLLGVRCVGCGWFDLFWLF